MTEEKQNEWIEWSGGECPVAADTLVLWQIRCETREEAEDYGGPVPAGELHWNHSQDTGFALGANIIAYRIVNALASTDRELEA